MMPFLVKMVYLIKTLVMTNNTKIIISWEEAVKRYKKAIKNNPFILIQKPNTYLIIQDLKKII